MSANDRAWQRLFDQYNILDIIERQGIFHISATQIKEHREPRLMTKFDHKANLPQLFRENNLSILPVTRGDYVISTFKAYKEHEDITDDIVRVSAPANIQTLIPQFIFSETIALNCAHACGILQDFLEEDELISTVSGRMSSGAFNFNIETLNGSKDVSVLNSQIEIDAAYEGINSLTLVEAKKDDLATDFLIRQLYYPYRTWKDRVTKNVRPVFLTYSNGLFVVKEYEFEETNNYSSISLLKQKNYLLGTEITLQDIENLLRATLQDAHEPNVPFPQANSMWRIINLLELLYESDLSKGEITAKYSFDSRQTNYYTDACRYLGLVEKFRDDERKVIFSLTDLGRRIMNLDYKGRQLGIAGQILKHHAFNEVFRRHLYSGEMPNVRDIVDIMRNSNLHDVNSESTLYRRSSTIVGWINWILSLIEE